MNIARAVFKIDRDADPQIEIFDKTGNFDDVLITGNPAGVVSFKFIESEVDEFYQISLSNVDLSITWNVQNKSSSGFNLEIKDAFTGDAYDPNVQCVVTVSR